MATDLATTGSDTLAALRQRLATPLNTAQPGAEKWAYDPTYDATVRNIQSGLAGLGSNVDLSESRIRADAQRNAQTLADTRDKTMQSLQERLAGQGIGRSSINTEESGNVLGAYNKDYESLATGETRSLEDMARETLGKVSDYNTQLSTAQAERASRETAREDAIAQQQAQAQAQKDQADQMRTQLESLRTQLLQQLTPQPTPTGALTLPPPLPPPKPYTPPVLTPPPAQTAPLQQQVSQLNVDPKIFQTLLRSKGFDPGPIDGVLGNRTQQAFNAYKQSIGLDPNAPLDNNMWMGLFPSGPDAGQNTFDLLGV